MREETPKRSEDSEAAGPHLGRLLEPMMNALFGRRRTLLVAPRFQLRAAALTTGTVMAGFLGLVGAIHLETLRIRDAMARLDADVGRELGVPGIDLLLFAAIAGFVAAGTFVAALHHSRRTAGAAYSLARTLSELGQGRFRVRARLRRSDHLTDLRDAVNGMAESLEAAAHREAATLDGLAERMDAAKDAAERARVAEDLRDLARQRRERLA